MKSNEISPRGGAIAPFAPCRTRRAPVILCTVAKGPLFLKNNSRRLFFSGLENVVWGGEQERNNDWTGNGGKTERHWTCANRATCTSRERARMYALETVYCFGFSPFVEHEHLLNKMGGLVRSETQWICMRSRDYLILLPSEVKGNKKKKKKQNAPREIALCSSCTTAEGESGGAPCCIDEILWLLRPQRPVKRVLKSRTYLRRAEPATTATAAHNGLDAETNLAGGSLPGRKSRTNYSGKWRHGHVFQGQSPQHGF